MHKSQLSKAVELYHERTSFYAWEIYDLLRSRNKRFFGILCFVAESSEPVTRRKLASRFPPLRHGGTDRTLEVNTAQHLHDLYAMELLTRERAARHTNRGSREYFYSLSDFGRLVLSYRSKNGTSD